MVIEVEELGAWVENVGDDGAELRGESVGESGMSMEMEGAEDGISSMGSLMPFLATTPSNCLGGMKATGFDSGSGEGFVLLDLRPFSISPVPFEPFI